MTRSPAQDEETTPQPGLRRAAPQLKTWEIVIDAGWIVNIWHTHTNTHTYIYTYIHTYTHTYIHIYICIYMFSYIIIYLTWVIRERVPATSCCLSVVHALFRGISPFALAHDTQHVAIILTTSARNHQPPLWHSCHHRGTHVDISSANAANGQLPSGYLT